MPEESSKPRLKLTIDRKTWAHGDVDASASYLLDDVNGRMCCLGFEAVQLCGYTPEEIRGIACPDGVNKPSRFAGAGLVECHADGEARGNTEVCARLMEVNDKDSETLQEQGVAGREAELTLLFAQRGIDLQFIN